MYIKYRKKDLKIKAISSTKPRVSKDCEIIEIPEITTTNLDYIVIYKENENIVIKERSEEEKQRIDKQKFINNKHKRIKTFAEEIKDHIENYYDELKQRSDINDKEFWSNWLLYHFSDKNKLDDFYQEIFESSNKILSEKSNLLTEIEYLANFVDFDDETLKDEYLIAVEQLLKVAVRQNWVQKCKQIYREIYKQIRSVNSYDDLKKIKYELPNFPNLNETEAR